MPDTTTPAKVAIIVGGGSGIGAACVRRFAADDARATAENARTLAEGLEHAGWLREDVTVEHAADVLFTLSSPQVHALLRRDCGWDVERYRQWLSGTLRATLLRRTAR